MCMNNETNTPTATAYVNTDAVERLRIAAGILRACSTNQQHFDMESYLKEAEASKKELSDRRRVRQDRAQKRTWIKRSMQISLLLILCELLGIAFYGHIGILIQIALVAIWCFTLTYQFWCKRTSLYRVLHKRFPECKFVVLQGIALAYRVLFLPIYATYLLWQLWF